MAPSLSLRPETPSVSASRPGTSASRRDVKGQRKELVEGTPMSRVAAKERMQALNAWSSESLTHHSVPVKGATTDHALEVHDFDAEPDFKGEEPIKQLSIAHEKMGIKKREHSIRDIVFQRIATLATTYFYGCSARSFVTGTIRVHQDRLLPSFKLVDLWDRKALAGSPDELIKDQYLFVPEVLVTRTWVLHYMASSILNGDDGLLKRVLGMPLIDVTMSTGHQSPVMAMVLAAALISITGDEILVFVALFVLIIVISIAYAANYPERFTQTRLFTAPFRLALFIVTIVQLQASAEMYAIFVKLMTLLLILADFVRGDWQIIFTYRFRNSYEILEELPNRVFICKRVGAAHLEEVSGQKAPISDDITGKVWTSHHSLIADMNGILAELRRPRHNELLGMHEEFQRVDEKPGYMALNVFSEHFPTLETLDTETMTEAARTQAILRHMKAHPQTWATVDADVEDLLAELNLIPKIPKPLEALQSMMPMPTSEEPAPRRKGMHMVNLKE